MYADIKRMAEVFSANVDAKAKLVFFALIYHAHKVTGEAFPSWNTLMRETGFSRSTICRSIKELESTGFITKINRAYNMPIYRLKEHPPGDISEGTYAQGGVSQTPGGVTQIPDGISQTPGWCHTDTMMVSHRHPNKSKEQKKITKAPTSYVGEGDGDNEKMFEEFWKAYPSECPQKVNKALCRKAYIDLLAGASDPARFHRMLLDSLAIWRKSELWRKEDGRFIRAPLAWLTRKSWEDEPAPMKIAQTKPKVAAPQFLPKHWELCAERCQNCSGNACRKGVKVPPAFSKNPFPPEDCDHFVSQVA